MLSFTPLILACTRMRAVLFLSSVFKMCSAERKEIACDNWRVYAWFCVSLCISAWCGLFSTFTYHTHTPRTHHAHATPNTNPRTRRRAARTAYTRKYTTHVRPLHPYPTCGMKPSLSCIQNTIAHMHGTALRSFCMISWSEELCVWWGMGIRLVNLWLFVYTTLSSPSSLSLKHTKRQHRQLHFCEMHNILTCTTQYKLFSFLSRVYILAARGARLRKVGVVWVFCFVCKMWCKCLLGGK